MTKPAEVFNLIGSDNPELFMENDRIFLSVPSRSINILPLPRSIINNDFMNYKFYKIIILLYFTKFYFIFEPALVSLYYCPRLRDLQRKCVPCCEVRYSETQTTVSLKRNMTTLSFKNKSSNLVGLYIIGKLTKTLWTDFPDRFPSNYDKNPPEF